MSKKKAEEPEVQPEGTPQAQESKEPEQKTLSLLPERRPNARNAVLDLGALPKTLPGPKPSQEMVQSVREIGVVEPIIVTVKGEGEEVKYRVRDGRRRVLAAREAGLEKIPARVYDEEDLRGEVLTLVLNEQRTSNPVAEAEAILELLKSGASEADVARDCKLTVATIRARLRLVQSLNGDIKKALRAGKIGVTLAHRISKMYVEAQERLAGKFKEAGKLTAKDVDEEVRVRRDAAVGALPLEAPPETGAAWRARAVPTLENALATTPASAPHGVRETLEAALKRIIEWGGKEAKEAAA